jgi:DNA-directed RNA polymerase subunit N (RpoN/RPB10)
VGSYSQVHASHSDALNAPCVTALRVQSHVRLRVLRVLQKERLRIHPPLGEGEGERGGRVVGELYVEFTTRLSTGEVACCDLNWELGVCVYVCVRLCEGITYDIENIENRREQGTGRRK